MNRQQRGKGGWRVINSSSKWATFLYCKRAHCSLPRSFSRKLFEIKLHLHHTIQFMHREGRRASKSWLKDARREPLKIGNVTSGCSSSLAKKLRFALTRFYGATSENALSQPFIPYNRVQAPTLSGCSWGASSLSLFLQRSMSVKRPVLPVAWARAYTTS